MHQESGSDLVVFRRSPHIILPPCLRL